MVTLDDENTEKLLDRVGWEILRELQENARIPFSELGRRVGLSAPAAAERVRRMEEAGIICGYRAEINLASVGLPMQAIIRFRSDAGRSPQLTEQVTQVREVLECYKVTGSDCYIIKVAVSSVEHLETLIDDLSMYGSVTTSLVLSTPVKHRVIAPG